MTEAKMLMLCIEEYLIREGREPHQTTLFLIVQRRKVISAVDVCFCSSIIELDHTSFTELKAAFEKLNSKAPFKN